MAVEEIGAISPAAAGHPELSDEQAHLDATQAAIQRVVDRPLKQDTGAGDFAAVLAMEAHRAWRRVQLREALQSPYFARIDLVPQGGDPRRVETYYVGKTYFEGDGVTITGWQAPVAALFYRSTGAQASYVAPAGELHVQLHLKRRLVIEHGALRLIADDLDKRKDERRKSKDEL